MEKQFAQLAISVPALGAPPFWNAGYTGQGESVGILDSGVRTNHPAFAGVSIVSQVFLSNGATDPCFADNAGSVQDQAGHGTHVAGIVASQGSAGWTNYQGVAKGIGTLYNLKVGYLAQNTDSCGDGMAFTNQSDVLAALDWAVQNTPLKIFNYSYGSPTTSDDDGYTQAIDQYIDNYGLTIAIAAGNGGPEYYWSSSYGVTSPGIAYNGITVANWLSRGVINNTSSSGPTQGGRYKPDLAAPGTNIVSTAYNWDAHPWTSDDFISMTGTSMAAPHIAGSAALLGSAGVTNPLAVKAILINSADRAGFIWDRGAGYGYTNLNTALGQLDYATGSLGATGLAYYRVSITGVFNATVTWNRHVSGNTSYLNNIDLHLYRLDTGEEIASTNDTVQNVETVSSEYSGEYSGDAVLAMAMRGPVLAAVSSEPYAVAFSVPASPMAGPKLSLACSVPAAILSGSQFTLACNVTNGGDLPAPAATGQATLPLGFSGGTQLSFGDVPPGSVSSPSTLTLAAPAVSGTYSISVTLSAGFALSALGNYAVTVQPAVPPPMLVSPANGASGVSTTQALSWAASAGATSYDVYFGTSLPPTLLATATTNSYAPPGVLPGTVYYWQVVAKNGSGSISSPVWSFTTQPTLSGQKEYVIVTVAGNGTQGYSGDGGPATSAQLLGPRGLTVDASGNLYIADVNQVVRKVAGDGIITTVAGCAPPCPVPGGSPATSLRLQYPTGVALDSQGDLYIADSVNNRIVKVSPDGSVATVAGNGGYGSTGDGGPAVNAELGYPGGVAVDAAGNIWIADTSNAVIRKVSPDGTINTAAGNRTWGYSGDGGPATAAELDMPNSVAVDAAGGLYIADGNNSRIRKVTPDGIITTLAVGETGGNLVGGCPGAVSQFLFPAGVIVDASGNVFVADSGNCLVRAVAPDGTLTTVAGNWSAGYSGDGGLATSAQLFYPSAVAVDAVGDVFVADGNNNVVRELIPADLSCRYRLDQTAVGASGAGGTFPISIQTGPACLWGVGGLPSWIASQRSGRGPAVANMVVAPSSGSLRTATILIAGTAVTVTQGDSACAYSLGSSFATAPASGGAGALTVTASPSCPWVVSGAPGWMTLTGATSGIGSGSVSYSVAPNTGIARYAALSVAGLSFDLQQLGVPGAGLRFVPVTPCRIADTRNADGPFGGPTLGTAETRSFAIPQSGCNIPSSAQAYSLNVTVVPQDALYYLTLWPTGMQQPWVSTLNAFQGGVVANAAVVPAGADGAVSVYVTNPSDVVLDINGYFDSPSSGSFSFYAAQPCRVADTRNAAGTFGGPTMQANQSRDFPVPISSCNIPVTARAYSLNATVAPQGTLGYLSTWPTGQTQPLVSTLNSPTGKVVANAALVPAGTNESISVYVTNPTDVILDINGYFGQPGSPNALSFYPVTPCRIADTRNANGPFGGPEMGDGETRSFPIPSSACFIPPNAAAYSLNVTVVPDGPLYYLTAWPAGAVQPLVSTLNSNDGSVLANAAIVPAGAQGAISVYVTNRSHVILDINGYFAP